MPIQYSLFESVAEMKFREIIWEEIDYAKPTKVKDVCKIIKDYYWEQTKNESKAVKIVPDKPEFVFLHKAYSIYHPDWMEKTHGLDVAYFYVDKAPDQWNNQCFYFELDECHVTDNHLGYSFFQKGGGINKERDVKKCCREAISGIKNDAKRKAIGATCTITGEILTWDNIDIHHEDLSFRELLANWIENKGGVDLLYKKVNVTVGNNAITEFTDENLIKDFQEYHNSHTHLIPLTKKGHAIMHCKKEK